MGNGREEHLPVPPEKGLGAGNADRSTHGLASGILRRIHQARLSLHPADGHSEESPFPAGLDPASFRSGMPSLLPLYLQLWSDGGGRCASCPGTRDYTVSDQDSMLEIAGWIQTVIGKRSDLH
jgi:hypothetical protein